MEKAVGNASQLIKLDGYLRQMAKKLPANIRHRLLNTLEHFKRAGELFGIDREMASFRAITGQEEGATALMLAIKARKYPHAKSFNPRSHQHKAAVLACVIAISNDIAPVFLKEFQLNFDFDKKRIDVKVPLSNFDVLGGKGYSLQPVEPLDLLHTKPDLNGARLFDRSLASLAEQSHFEDIKELVAAQAKARNNLLYASDSGLPLSKATWADIEKRQRMAITLLSLAIMVLQCRKHQALVCEAITAFLGVIGKLPKEELS